MHTGRAGGKKGGICSRPPSEHCEFTFRMCSDSNKDACKKVHHAFQRTYCCPTCGSRERPTSPPPKAKWRYCDDCDGVGWYEGGAALKTSCKKCAGTGVLTNKGA